ncbi:MAG TPA: universal stress protein [Pirellulales bacterium]
MYASKKILFATDYSASTDEILTYAASLAREKGASLLITHVSRLEPYPIGELFDDEPEPCDAEVAELDAIAPPDPGLPCEHRLLYGDPAEEIVKLADQECVDAIVLGTRRHSGLARLFGGGVADKVKRAAHCPVYVYRGHDGQRPTNVAHARAATR